ncbi:MAG: SIR2 family protein [Burkholderiales bacterium]|nr:SIR2 family protein [Burkholderiales bacterium]
MNEQIRAAFLEGKLILFLGAGASFGSSNSTAQSPPLSRELAKVLAERCGWAYSGERLSVVYAAARKQLALQLDDLLARLYEHCRPSPEYIFLAQYPWARVYTTNIDDAFEHALLKHSKQKVNVRGRDDRVADKDQMFGQLDYIYLNGSIRRPDQGFIFSPEEYGRASAASPKWYDEVASDYLQCTFVFIGTTIDEPVFHHHVERYKSRAGTGSPRSYVVLPSATQIEIAGFDSSNLQYLAGTLQDFVSWLKTSVPSPPQPVEVAQNRFPELRALLDKTSKDSQQAYADLLAHVTVVSRQGLASAVPTHSLGTTRPFYKGFKPGWRDLLDGVPAVLEQYQSLATAVHAAIAANASLLALIGPAGSGKSTALKWLALALADEGRRVYFLESATDRLADILLELERANSGRFFVVIERLDPIKSDLTFALGKLTKAFVVGAESQNVWHNRLTEYFDRPSTRVEVLREIAESDANGILAKLQQYGPWTRLANLSPKERKRELFVRSKRQLLIGLMETTTGIGFDEIVIRDFAAIAVADRLFFVIVCIATLHRSDLSLSVAARALSHLSKSESPKAVVARLQGIVDQRHERFVARHPVYARKIIDSIADRKLVSEAIVALLMTFTVYPHPVVKSLDSNDATLFKSLINHRFLADALRSDPAAILGVYIQFEKYFESDGLYWLQYGLSMRSFGRHVDAYELLQTAYNAYPHDHTIHAYAQQKLILAGDGSVASETARSYVVDAIKMLTALDQVLESDDTYPIVTLAEGHVKALRKLDGDALARVKAKEYVDSLERRLKKGPNPRLHAARARLFGFAATGAWKDD